MRRSKEVLQSHLFFSSTRCWPVFAKSLLHEARLLASCSSFVPFLRKRASRYTFGGPCHRTLTSISPLAIFVCVVQLVTKHQSTLRDRVIPALAALTRSYQLLGWMVGMGRANQPDCVLLLTIMCVL